MNHFHTLFDYISEKQLQPITKAVIGKVSGGLTPDILSPQQKRRSRLRGGKCHTLGKAILRAIARIGPVVVSRNPPVCDSNNPTYVEEAVI